MTNAVLFCGSLAEERLPSDRLYPRWKTEKASHTTARRYIYVTIFVISMIDLCWGASLCVFLFFRSTQMKCALQPTRARCSWWSTVLLKSSFSRCAPIRFLQGDLMSCLVWVDLFGKLWDTNPKGVPQGLVLRPFYFLLCFFSPTLIHLSRVILC